jgi:superfamily II DNA/RNA helicase
MMINPIEITMSTEQQKAYEAMKKELYYQYEQGEITAINAGVKMIKLLQISAGAVKDDDGKILYLDDSPKVNYILDIWKNDLNQGKLVVVSAFRASVERLTEIFKREKIRSEFIYGQMTLNQRTNIINDFQSGDLQILVVQPQAVSHGITLDATNFMIWHSLVASGEIYSQMKDRIISASQKKKQIVEFLLGSKADKNVYNILSGKADFSAGVLEMFANKNL